MKGLRSEKGFAGQAAAGVEIAEGSLGRRSDLEPLAGRKVVGRVPDQATVAYASGHRRARQSNAKICKCLETASETRKFQRGQMRVLTEKRGAFGNGFQIDGAAARKTLVEVARTSGVLHAGGR